MNKNDRIKMTREREEDKNNLKWTWSGKITHVNKKSRTTIKRRDQIKIREEL